MTRPVTRIALAVAGAMLGLIGVAMMAAPQAFLESSHVIVEADPGLMSELTAPAGLLVLSGGLMMLGAVRLRFAAPALVAGALVYGSYGAGRLVSMALHGLPSQSLIAATGVELGVAALLTALAMTGRQTDRSPASRHPSQWRHSS